MSTATAAPPSWKVRHQGSPRAIEGLNVQQVVEGLTEGLWEPTDEVMGPGEHSWVAIENHPQFAEIAAELDQPEPKEQDDETRLDMNPLIDVALVLLIFFIITATYTMLQEVLDMPQFSQQSLGKIQVVSKAQVDKFTIKVEARQVDGKPVIKVEDQVVDPRDLVTVLHQYVKDTRKTEMLLDAQGVSWGTVIAIQDAAKGAGVTQALMRANPGTK